jgi:hypothetical protein
MSKDRLCLGVIAQITSKPNETQPRDWRQIWAEYGAQLRVRYHIWPFHAASGHQATSGCGANASATSTQVPIHIRLEGLSLGERHVATLFSRPRLRTLSGTQRPCRIELLLVSSSGADGNRSCKTSAAFRSSILLGVCCMRSKFGICSC